MRQRHQHEDADSDDAFDENGILKDGRSVRVSLTMMDADSLSPLQRAVAQTSVRVTDGQGDAAGLHRPGFRLAGVGPRGPISDAATTALDAAYRDYEEALTSAWRSPDVATPERQRATDTVDTADQLTMDEVYARYDTELREAWRRA